MKPITLLLLMAGIGFGTLTAQNLQERSSQDQQLAMLADPLWLHDKSDSNPFVIKRWQFIAQESYIIVDEPTGKKAGNLRPLNVHSDQINLIELLINKQIERLYDRRSYYLTNDHKVLILYAQSEVNQALKRI